MAEKPKARGFWHCLSARFFLSCHIKSRCACVLQTPSRCFASSSDGTPIKTVQLGQKWCQSYVNTGKKKKATSRIWKFFNPRERQGHRTNAKKRLLDETTSTSQIFLVRIMKLPNSLYRTQGQTNGHQGKATLMKIGGRDFLAPVDLFLHILG